MTILELLLAPEVLPFSVSLGVMLIIGALEGIGAILGFAFSGLLDNLIPEADLDFDLDTPELEHGAFSEFLTWLRFREVPVIFILIAFLTSFGLVGLGIQQIVANIFGGPAPLMIAVPAAFILSLPCVRFFAGVLAKIMPQDETSAVSSSTFIGRTATITLGTARANSAAQGKLKDEHGQDHYAMIEPDMPDSIFKQGENVLIVRQDGNIFYAIETNNE